MFHRGQTVTVTHKDERTEDKILHCATGDDGLLWIVAQDHGLLLQGHLGWTRPYGGRAAVYEVEEG